MPSHAGGLSRGAGGREGDVTAILVIKLGALGDFVQATGPFAAIRAHHPAARIVLLTAKPFAALARQAPWFNEVWIDAKPRLLNAGGMLALRTRLKSGGFSRVYDLQTSDRSSWYFHLLRPHPPEWSGIALGCSHPHANPRRDSMHTLERQADQLRLAGIEAVPPPDLSWAVSDTGRFNLPARFALLAAGGAKHRPAKRWPAERFALLANHLAAKGVTPVLLGTQEDDEAIRPVQAACPAAIDLSGQTSFADIATLARSAEVCIGNDTGPMHLAAPGGRPCLVLFSHESDPALCAPRGKNVTVLRRPSLAQLAVEDVEEALRLRA